jgi:hypothetical protein
MPKPTKGKPDLEDIKPGDRRQSGADFHQPIRGNEPPTDGKMPGNEKLRGEDRSAIKSPRK